MKRQTITGIIIFISLLFVSDSFGKIGIVVNKDLYPSIRTAIQTYANDLVSLQGKQVWIDSTSFSSTSSISSLRGELISRYNTDALEGAVFVGDLPIAFYENNDDWGNYAGFPSDLYFMDLDGQWLDNAKDGDWNGWAHTGYFDKHVDTHGIPRAEIWVSRIVGSIVEGLGNEADITNNYFGRLHTRMANSEPSPERMLVCGYNVDWEQHGGWTGCIGMANPDVLGYQPPDIKQLMRIGIPERDSRENYMAELRRGYEYTSLFEHSSCYSHELEFYRNFTNYDYCNMDSQKGGPSNTRFYNLFACSNARFTETNFMAGIYAWGHNGLLSIGSTKTGSMLGYEIFNPLLAQGMSFGDAFKIWLNEYVFPIPDNSKVSWHYGMVMCGAPTVALHAPASNLPYAPTMLITNGISTNQINLTWLDNSTGETGFYIERAIGVSGSFSRIATLGSGVTSYSNTGISANTTYRYRVQAYNSYGVSGYTNIATEVTSAPNAPLYPGAYGPYAYQIDIYWSDDANNETGYAIERASSSSGPWVEIGITQPDVTNFHDYQLLADTQYWYRIRAVNVYGNSAYTSPVSAQALSNAMPSAPTGLTATVISPYQVDLSWNDNAVNEDGFQILQKINYLDVEEEVGQVGANITSFSVTNLMPNTTYFFRVQAYNGYGSAWSEECVSPITTENGAPAAPSGLGVYLRTNHQVELYWTDNASEEDGFYIERATSSSGPFTRINTLGVNEWYNWSVDLAPNTTYWYRVRAFNSEGASPYSNTANITTPAAVAPVAPSDLIASLQGGDEVYLSWNDNSNNERNFVIERATGTGSFVLIGYVDRNVFDYVETTISPSTNYQYRVYSANEDGNSSYSNIASIGDTDYDVTDDQLGTITARGENTPNEGKYKAFDNSSSTKWLDFSPSGSWIQYAFAGGITCIVNSYTITSANDHDERDPADWQLQGSNDGANWTEIDSRTGQSFTARFQKRIFTCPNYGIYAMYRLTISRVKNPSTANSVQLAEIELIGHRFDNPIAPSITSQPQSATVNEGDPVSFSVDATGTEPLSYQWQKNGSNISGETSSSYSISSCAESDEGTYRVVVSNSVGSDTSNGATLTVVPPINYPPVVATPASASPNPVSGTTTSLSVLGADDGGEANLSYTWSTTGTPPGPVAFSINGTNASKNTTATFTVSGEYDISVTIADQQGLTVDTNVIVTVDIPGTDYDVTDDQLGTITARGENTPNEGKDKAFDNSSSTKWLDFSPSGSWIHYTFAGGTTCIVTSYTITSANDHDERDPADWQLQGSNDGVTWTEIDSRTGQSFTARFQKRTFTCQNYGIYAMYRLTISRVKNPSTANSVQLAEIELIGHRLDNPIAPSITSQPQSATVNEGDPVSFSVDATGTEPLSYQWQKNGSDISGATGSSYSISSCAESDEGTYRVMVSNSVGSVTSNGATLTVDIPGTDYDVTDDQLGTITARGENTPNEGKDKAFDNTSSTKWLDFSPSGSWIQYTFAGGQTYAINSYTITSANDHDERDPADWQLQGSNDGVTWTEIDSRTGQSFTARFQKRTFTCPIYGIYAMYRLTISRVKNPSTANSVQLAEIELIGH